MPWDYSIYPELTEEQNKVFTEAGETLFMIQSAEFAIQTCIIFAFQEEDIQLEKIYSEESKIRKKTLGQIVKVVKKNIALHPEFYDILNEFVEQRNHFVHELFFDKNHNFIKNEDCVKLQKYLRDIQDNAWNIDKVFWGYLLYWLKDNGIYEHLPKEFKENKHFKQIEENSFHLLFQKPGTNLTHFVSIKKK